MAYFEGNGMRNRISDCFSGLVVASIALPLSGVVWGQPYPTKPIRMVTSAAGGSSDFAARLVAQGMSQGLGQQVIIDNRGGGVAAIEIVVKAPADGYTLLYYGSILWLLPLLQDGVPYDTLRDFAPVALVVSSPVVVIVNAAVPAKTIKDLIALAKSKPGALNYSSGGAGSTGHLAAELFKSMAGVNMVRIPYKGSGPALAAVVSGEVQLLMASAGGMESQIRAGRVRAVAVTGAKRSPSFPDLPTVAESGLPGFEYGQMSGIFAPAKSARTVVTRLNQEVARVLARPDVKEKFFQSGAEPSPETPQEFGAKIKAEIARIGKVIKDAGIRAE
jgi:tripartite-type tricarboxylate transporter receptor subunit TctC